MNRCRFVLLLVVGIATNSLVGATERWLEKNGRIRGGSAITEAIPWYAVFEDTTLCGGIQVYGDIIVTTASCIDDGREPVRVRVGSLQRYSGGNVSRVQRTRIHPDWRGDVAQGNDIAVMKIGDNVQNETLAALNTFGIVPAVGDQMLVVGFGQTDNQQLPDNLQGLTYDFISDCESRYDGYNPTLQLCGNATKAQGACFGDGGSPAIVNGTVVGLSSFSDGLCESQSFDVYTRISTYEDWIQEQICALSALDPPGCSSSCLLEFQRLRSAVASFFGY